MMATARPIWEDCEECDGYGYIDTMCSTCNGSGEGMADGTTCGTCRGKGGEDVECEVCDGTGTVEIEYDDDDVV